MFAGLSVFYIDCRFGGGFAAVRRSRQNFGNHGGFWQGLRNFKTGLKGSDGDNSEADAIEEAVSRLPKSRA